MIILANSKIDCSNFRHCAQSRDSEIAKMRFTHIFGFLLLVQVATAQSNTIRFDNISIHKGLSQSSVNAIIQDKAGFIWIGTQDGLNRFDGYDFLVYRNIPQQKNSLSSNFVYSIYEDRDSNLWVGTEQGLNKLSPRYTTVSRYLMGGGEDADYTHSAITAICDGPDNNLWVGTAASGLILLDKETRKTTAFTYNQGDSKSISSNGISSIYRDKNGWLWVGTIGGGLNFVDEKTMQFRRINSANSGLASNVVWGFSEDLEGKLWVATNNGINQIKGRGIEVTPVQVLGRGMERNSIIKAIMCDSSGEIWLGKTGGGLSRLTYENGRPRATTYVHNELAQSSLSSDIVQCIFEDMSGAIWVGTNNGISKFDPVKQVFNHITWELNSNRGLNDKNVWCITKDRQGTLWVGTRRGLNSVDQKTGNVRHYNRTARNINAPNNNSVYALYVDKSNTLWVGAVDGLFRLRNAADQANVDFQPIEYKSKQQGADNRVYALYEDDEGFLWIGTREGLARMHMASMKHRFYKYSPEDPGSIGENRIRAIMKDSQGTMWIGTEGGGLNKAVFNGKGLDAEVSFIKYKNNNDDPLSLSNNSVTALLEGEEGAIWVGTYGGGINSFQPKTGEFTHYSESEGLANNVVYSILDGGDNTLWMSTNKGLSSFHISDKKFMNYEETDGLQSNEFNIGAYYRSPEGELYFGGINGLNYFNPTDVGKNDRKPKVVITRLLLFNKEIPVRADGLLSESPHLAKSIELKYRENNLTFEFAALHFSNSGRNRYRYILEGADEGWIDAGTDRSANYLRTPPGNYVFKVLGSNSDGVWSSEIAKINVIVRPPFWGTWWFRSLLVVLLLGAVGGIMRIRTRTILRQKETLSRLVAQRTRKTLEQKRKIEAQKKVIELEKEKVDNLLMNVLPRQTVEELKTKGKASARSFNNVSIMFTDFKDFTRIAENNDPAALVEKLDSYFSVFDDITSKFGIEKIKTIGDAYMCAGGLPIRNKSNAIDTVLAGLEIQNYMRERRAEEKEAGLPSWGLRIGIHSGALIAGVIGTKRFAYDIWGDAVNIANRIETAGETDKVNISGKTFELIEPYFECTYRGKIPAKNKGEIDMYFVDCIKAELSIDGLGLTPNEQFWENVDLHLYSNIKQRNAEKHIIGLLKRELDKNLHYHDVRHTLDVFRAVERIANTEGIKGEDLFLLKTAALYHDAGFIRQYQNNEPIGAEMAREALPNFGYTPSQIEVIAGLIYATAIPHNPQTHLQEIICDADLDYLGREDFNTIADTLRRELMERGYIKSYMAWDQMQVDFLNQHRFFTSSSINLRRKGKLKHLEEIEKRLKENKYDQEPTTAPTEEVPSQTKNDRHP